MINVADEVWPPSRVRFWSRQIGAIVVALGTTVLAGWILGVGAMKGDLPGLVTMKVNTAVGFILSGLSLWFQTAAELNSRQSRNGRICAVALLVLSLLTIFEFLTGWSLAIDELIVQDIPPTGMASDTYIPGRMSPVTAVLFLLVGTALLIVDTPDATWLV